MFDTNAIWQKRFCDPAILSPVERVVLEKLQDGAITFNGLYFLVYYHPEDISEILDQLEVDEWITFDGKFYSLSPDAPSIDPPLTKNE